MKLGELRSAIRNHKGNPFVRVALAPGQPLLNLPVLKKGLYETLALAFPGGLAVETGLEFDTANGMIYVEGPQVADDQHVRFGEDDLLV